MKCPPQIVKKLSFYPFDFERERSFLLQLYVSSRVQRYGNNHIAQKSRRRRCLLDRVGGASFLPSRTLRAVFPVQNRSRLFRLIHLINCK